MNARLLKALIINVGRLSMSLGLAGVAWVSAISCALAVEQKQTDWREAVVLIERPREGGLPPEIGTGFFVSSEGHILTAAHLLLESNELGYARRQPVRCNAHRGAPAGGVLSEVHPRRLIAG
jgi:hypothetical protein